MISVLRPNSSLYKELIKILINADKAGKDKLYMDFIKRPKLGEDYSMVAKCFENHRRLKNLFAYYLNDYRAKN